LNGALSAVVPATMETVRAVIVALLPVHTRDDVAYRSALLDWVPTAMSARVRGEDPPAMPERPPLAEVVSEPPLRAKATHVSPGGIVDAEIVDDDDPDEDLPGDAELLADIERLRAMVAAG
jgi:hypothetical protein